MIKQDRHGDIVTERRKEFVRYIKSLVMSFTFIWVIL